MTQPPAEHPFVSIVVPTSGRPDRLADCLRAIASLDYPPDRYEVVVVDDGSAEPARSRIWAVCASAGARLEQQPHAGPAAGRNRGARLARGAYVAFLDDDCEPSPDWLSHLVVCFEGRADRAVAGRTVNALPANRQSAASQALADFFYRYHRGTGGQPQFVSSNNLALDAGRFRALGGFDESFPVAGSEDRDLCDRWVAAGHSLLLAPDAVVLHRHPLTLRAFVRKHFDYGRGAFHFRRARARRRVERIRVEPPRFYIDLVTSPLRATRSRTSAVLALLLLLAQVANTAGFFAEALRDLLPRRRGGRFTAFV